MVTVLVIIAGAMLSVPFWELMVLIAGGLVVDHPILRSKILARLRRLHRVSLFRAIGLAGLITFTGMLAIALLLEGTGNGKEFFSRPSIAYFAVPFGALSIHFYRKYRKEGGP